MRNPDAYVTLVASLPSSERLFFAKKPPLSRLRLEKRLTALSEEDAHTLKIIEDALNWSRYGLACTEQEALERGRAAIAAIPQPTLRALVAERLELRSVVAALRLRRDGNGPPSLPWGHGRWMRHVVANWTDPTFRLSRHLPWLAEAGRLIDARDALGLERHILDITHRSLKRRAAGHLFDFEAVAIYVLEWNIFDRWARANGAAAIERFELLADQAMADIEGPFCEAVADV